MIRVVIRHIEDVSDAVLLGDFPPDQIDALLNLLGRTRIYFSDEHDNAGLFPGDEWDEGGGPLQFMVSGVGKTQRMVLEVLLD